MESAVRDAINDQIRDELFAAYLYMAMSAHFSNQSLEGFSNWMRLQAQEELGHAMRLFDYLLERGEPVVFHPIDQPPTEYGSPLSIFEMALAHERKVTRSINDLYALAVEKFDYPTQLQLQWFINEQVEEEASSGLVIEQLKMIGDDNAVLLMLDEKLGGRTDAE
jgi:ferritin